MFPAIVQQTFAWLVPACIGALGVASLRAWRKHASGRTAWQVAAGSFAVAHAVLTVGNLALKGSGNIPFSGGPVGYGPRYVVVYFFSYSCLIGATVCWSLASLRSRPGGGEP